MKSIINMQNYLIITIIFETLALSKILYLTLITSFSKQLIKEIQII